MTWKLSDRRDDKLSLDEVGLQSAHPVVVAPWNCIKASEKPTGVDSSLLGKSDQAD
jgi:hypothetical protein